MTHGIWNHCEISNEPNHNIATSNEARRLNQKIGDLGNTLMFIFGNNML